MSCKVEVSSQFIIVSFIVSFFVVKFMFQVHVGFSICTVC